ncbi:MAG: flagellar biosynthetic protein FliO [Planctomycetota bacterium]
MNKNQTNRRFVTPLALLLVFGAFACPLNAQDQMPPEIQRILDRSTDTSRRSESQPPTVASAPIVEPERFTSHSNLSPRPQRLANPLDNRAERLPTQPQNLGGHSPVQLTQSPPHNDVEHNVTLANHESPTIPDSVHRPGQANKIGAIDRLQSRKPVPPSDTQNSSIFTALRSRAATDSSTSAESTGQPSLDGGTQTEAGLADLIQRIGYYTLIVISIAMGFIFLAKLWQNKKQSNSTDETAGFKILSQLPLAGKATLTLISVEDERLVVATDLTGCKSVVRLGSSVEEEKGSSAAPRDAQFQDVLREFETESPPRNANPSGTYSLGTIGQRVGDTDEKAERQTSKEPTTASLQKQMEAAMVQFGLKEMFMKTLQEDASTPRH